jgi:hypothetical protein
MSGENAECEKCSDDLDGAVRAFIALALADPGREREALAIGLDALSQYLPRYNRSLARYAQQLAQPPAPGAGREPGFIAKETP